MMQSNNCPRCQGTMTEGFILDRADSTDSTSKVATWVEGVPERGWFGSKVGKRAKHEIRTWRCGRCGFLESYARDDTK